MPFVRLAAALRIGETFDRDVTRAAGALLSNEGIVSSFEHARGSQRDVRADSRVTRTDKMRAKNDYDFGAFGRRHDDGRAPDDDWYFARLGDGSCSNGETAGLERARGRDDAPLPGGAASRYAQSSRQRTHRRRVFEASARQGRHSIANRRLRHEAAQSDRQAERER